MELAFGGGKWERILDSLIDWESLHGPAIAWESDAHKQITTDARNALIQDMRVPKDARRKLLHILNNLPDAVVLTDITIEQFSDTSWGRKFLPQTGQATHFMGNTDQPQMQAWEAGMKKVFDPVDDAAERLQQWLYDGDVVTAKLGDGIHALQDSFSPAHVQRKQVNGAWIIEKIFVWADQKKEGHKSGDESWKRKDGEALRKACQDATVRLLRYFIARFLRQTDVAFQEQWGLQFSYFGVAIGVLTDR
jgi:hypothetical protein